MGLFSAKEKNELALVFDLGSSSVGGALFEINKDKPPKIVYALREPLVLLPKPDIDQFLSLTFKTLSTVAGKIARAGVGAPERIFCVLGSPWYASQTRVVRLEKNSPFSFTAKLADELIQKEIIQFKQEHALEYQEEKDQSALIELKNMKITLNGYPTSEPLDKKVKELEMTLFVSVSAKHFLEKVKEIVGNHFHRNEVKFSSFAMASFTVARDLGPRDDFLLVDIGAEMTAISIVKKGILSESGSYPLGRNFIIRSVAGELQHSLDEAKTLVSLYKDEHTEDRLHLRLAKVIEKGRAEWLKKFQESLAGLSGDISMPSTVFVTADPDLADFFSETIKNERLSQYTLTDSKFETVFLNPEALHGAAAFAPNVLRDPHLVIESVYLNRYLC